MVALLTVQANDEPQLLDRQHLSNDGCRYSLPDMQLPSQHSVPLSYENHQIIPLVRETMCQQLAAAATTTSTTNVKI